MSLIPLLGLFVAAFLVFSILYTAHSVFLGPLSRFPGPKLAALSEVYELYHHVLKDDWLETIEALHRQYGPIVRIGPNELHMIDHEFCLAHQRRSDLIKPPRYYGYLGHVLGGLETPRAHAHRKQAVQPLFQGNALAEFSTGKLNDLLRSLRDNCMSASARSGGRVNMTYQLFAFTNDVMFSYVLGRESPPEFLKASDLQAAHDSARTLGAVDIATVTRAVPWLQELLVALLHAFPTWSRKWTPLWWIDQIMIDRLGHIKSLNLGEKLSTQVPSVLEAVLQRLDGNAGVAADEASHAVFIGNEALLSNLTFMLHFFVQNGHVVNKLRQELDSLNVAKPGTEVWEDPSVMKLPYLDAVFRETTRLSHAGWHRQPRQVNETIHYKGMFIPPMTSLSFTPALLEVDPTLFENPTFFRPERWLGPEGAKLKARSVTFGTGSRTCLAQHLARVVLCKTAAALVYSFDFTHCDNIAGSSGQYGYLNVPFPKKGTEEHMILKVTPRVVGEAA